MLIGVISDAHANACGTNACLKWLVQQSVENIWFCGDVVGYNAEVAETVSMIRASASRVVLGNHDAMLFSEVLTPQGQIRDGIRIAQAKLNAEEIAWLAALSPILSFTCCDCNCWLVHGTVAEPLDGRGALEDCMDAFSLGASVLAYGHTHIPFHAVLAENVAVNPGTCGLPRDNDPRASCSIINLKTRDVHFHRLMYDPTGVLLRNHEAGVSSRIAGYLLTGQDVPARIADPQDHDAFTKLGEEIAGMGFSTIVHPCGIFAEVSGVICSIVQLEHSNGPLLLQSSPLPLSAAASFGSFPNRVLQLCATKGGSQFILRGLISAGPRRVATILDACAEVLRYIGR